LISIGLKNSMDDSIVAGLKLFFGPAVSKSMFQIQVLK
jgi:hypothetical protein